MNMKGVCKPTKIEKEFLKKFQGLGTQIVW